MAVAKAVGSGVVINADASQVYTDLRVLSARPSDEEMASVPHHLFGHIDAAESHNAARWADEAGSALTAAHAAGTIPILVGGTGLHIRTLLHGISHIPEIDPDVRAVVRALPVADARAALAREDPDTAARLYPADTTRIARALEVVRSTGHPLGHWHATQSGGIGDKIALKPIILLPPRDWLRDRCDQRLVQMFDGGAIDEVRALLARDLDPDLPAMRAIGVPQIARYLKGAIDLGEALTLTQAATRQYAKRQYTWFRNQAVAEWPRHFESLNNDFIDRLAIILRQRLLTG